MVVAFFGHKDAPNTIYPALERTIREIIEQNGEVSFYVGTHGAFDRMALSALKQAAERYPQIEYHVVLAYLPTKKEDNEYEGLPTVFPEGIEAVPKRFAIDYRNKFMINESDTVICFVDHEIGSNSKKYVEKAKKHGRTIINLIERL